MGAVRYEFDELNRLVIDDPLDAAQPRRVVEGRMQLDRRNRLRYRARTRAGRPGGRGASDVLLDGTWTLSPAHELGLLLHPSQDAEREALFLRGAVVDAADNALIFSTDHRARDGRRTSQRLSLAGRWQADDRNRLTFLASKADGTDDRLVFDGAWAVERQQLLYRYEQASAGRRRAVQTVRFAGGWDVRPHMRLAYQVGASDRSVFEFEAALQSPTLNARDGRLTYQVGIRLSDGTTVQRTVALFGAWTLNRDLSVSFELSAPERRARRLTFRGELALNARDRLTVQLADQRGEPIGLSITFSREFLKDTAWFVRLQRDGGDSGLFGGLQVRW